MARGNDIPTGLGGLPQARPGQPLTAKAFNATRDAVASITGGDGIAVQHVGNRVIISAIGNQIIPVTQGAKFWASGIGWAKVTSEGNDTIACNFYDPSEDTTGDSVTIAKPYLLRKTPFDGETITYPSGDIAYSYTTSKSTRTATQGAYSEVQIVTPQYYVGEVVRIASGDTAVADVSWEDLNTGGRAWARRSA